MITKRGKIIELIVSNSKNPNKTALHLHTGEVVTYGELILLMKQTQSAIEEFDIKPHERIVPISSNSLIYLSLLLAVMESATCVPLDPELTIEEYLMYFELLGVDYLMCDQAERTAIEAAKTSGIGMIEFHVENIERPSLKFKLMHKFRSDHNQLFKNDQTAFIFTTSGTTSTPKVVPKLYHDMADALQIEAPYLDMAERSVHLVAVQLFRFMTIWNMLKVLMTNGSTIYVDGMNPKRITDMLQKFRITHILLPPAGLYSFYEYIERNSIDYTYNHPMLVEVYGAPLPQQLKGPIEKRFNATVVDIYGMTEIGITTSTYKAPKGYKAGSVGFPLAQEIKILDNEVLVKGVGVFSGYENNPEVNSDSFIDGWFRTGDVGYLNEDGYLFIKGRIRELINRGGEKVSPFEIEEAILSIENIKDVTVFPYPNNRGSDDVGAVIIPYEGSPISLRELRTVLKDRIKPYKLPTLLYYVEEIPRSPAGKVQRNFLYQQLNELNLIPQTLKNAPALANSEANLTSTQSIIQEIWKTILEQDFVYLDDNFFDLGGDSLSAAELLASIETNFGCVLPISEFFNKSTVRELAELVEATPKFNRYNHLVPIRTEGDKTPLFLVHEISGDVVTYQYVAQYIDKNRPVYGLKLNFQKNLWNKSITLTEVAQTYVDEIKQLVPTGPYYLGGLSIGGTIAFEMAQILNQRGYNTIVFMIDSFSRQYLLKGIRVLFKPAFAKIKTAPLQEMPKLVWKKTKTLVNVVGKVIQSNIALEHRDPINGESNLDSESKKGSDFLAFITSKYQPEFYPGEIYYFRALHKENNSSYDDWKSLSRKCVLIQKNCGHSDFVKPEYANDTAIEINTTLERHDAKE